MNIRRFLSAVLIATAAFAGTTLLAQGKGVAGAVYTMSNAADGNAVLVFGRLANGHLVASSAVATGGLGTGSGLGNQGGVVLSRDERWLLAVNAGSDSLSVFRVHSSSLELTDHVPSGGVRPLSVSEHGGLVYVVHAGSDTLTGFQLSGAGELSPIAGSTRSLSSAGAGPAQISFTPDGRVLVITEKNTNRILTFPVDRDGLPGIANVHDSNGQTPFGFSFGKRGQLVVSEAFGGAPDASAASSYEIDKQGVLTSISASVGTNQTAACWALVTPGGRYAYTTNTGSGSITGYSIGVDGQLELLDADGRTGLTGDGSSPIDLAFSGGGRFLYSLNGGAHTISGFRVQPDGSLQPLPVAAGLPPGTNGLAAR